MSIVGTAPPAQVGYAQEAMQQLREAMLHLPPEEKEVFLLRQNGGLSYEQIAQLHNRPVAVVKGQMRSALRKLRTVFQEATGEPNTVKGVEDASLPLALALALVPPLALVLGPLVLACRSWPGWSWSWLGWPCWFPWLWSWLGRSWLQWPWFCWSALTEVDQQKSRAGRDMWGVAGYPD
jgi:DNA-binding CsgD family transcriptional regulator